MRIVNLKQGSPEWLAHRAKYDNASDAPVMMGCSPYKTRAQLLRERKTGLSPDVDASTQRIFDAGHRYEALARPLMEEIVGEELYPCVGVDGTYSMSSDGLTLDFKINSEHKSLNEELRAILPTSDDVRMVDPLPLHYRVQMEHQMLVSGAEKTLFMASKWEGDELVEERHCWYLPDLELRARIIAGWEQFHRDLESWVVPEEVEAAPIGKTPDSLPALRIEVTGYVTASNLADFKRTALEAIRSVNRDLKTDNDFADADKAVKWCAEVESKLKAAKEHALSQTADIEALFRTLDDIAAEARTVRLDLDKLVTRRKTEVKEHAIASARRALDAHVADLNGEIAPMRLKPIYIDFALAIKGLRSIASMQEALDVALANSKIEADVQARKIRANVASFHAAATGYEFLFADLNQIVHKDGEDFITLVDSRIRAHNDAMQRKKEAAEAAIKHAAELAEKHAEAERNRIAEDARKAMLDHASDVVAVTASHISEAAAEVIERPVITLPDQSPATLKLGQIAMRLGFVVTREFLADIGIVHAARDKNAALYRESQWPRIKTKLIEHITDLV